MGVRGRGWACVGVNGEGCGLVGSSGVSGVSGVSRCCSVVVVVLWGRVVWWSVVCGCRVVGGFQWESVNCTAPCVRRRVNV